MAGSFGGFMGWFVPLWLWFSQSLCVWLAYVTPYSASDYMKIGVVLCVPIAWKLASLERFNDDQNNNAYH